MWNATRAPVFPAMVSNPLAEWPLEFSIDLDLSPLAKETNELR